jgi:hypothetical protein
MKADGYWDLLPQFPPGSLVDGILFSCCFCTCCALPHCLAPSGAVVSQALPCVEGDIALLHVRLADVFEA